MSTFQNDIRVAGRSETPLTEILGRNGLPDKSWLVDKFDLNLAMIAKHAGHSHPRTLRTGDGMPGMTITYALIQRVEKVAEVSDRARIITKAEVSRLLSRAGSVVGCEYQKFGRSSKEYGPVILCTGGFAAGVGPGSVLAKYRPDLVNLPTASAEHCTGDGLKLGEDVGAKTLDLEWVQLHPTGLIHLDEPEAPRKAIAGEIFRAAGALLLDACGERFCNELGPADHILEEMSKRPGRAPFWLCLNTAASRELQRQCRAFTRRRLMKCYASGKELAQEMRIPLEKLVEVHDAHAEAFRRTLRDAGESEAEKGANGTGPRSYDEVSGKLGFGKCDFRNVLVGSRVPDETFHAAQVTPGPQTLRSGVALTFALACQVLDDAVPRQDLLHAVGCDVVGWHLRSLAQSVAFLLGRGAGTSAGPRLAGCVSLQAEHEQTAAAAGSCPSEVEISSSQLSPRALPGCSELRWRQDDLRDESLCNNDPTDEILDDAATNKLKHVSFKDDSSRPTSCTRYLPSDRGTSLSGSNSKKGVPLTTFVLEARKRKMLQGRIKLLSFLGKNGFKTHDVNAKKSGVFGFSRTYPLHEAAKQDHASMVRWLLHFGADSAKKDSSGRTAYDYVKTKPPSDEVRRVLEKHDMCQRQSAWHRIWPPQGFDEFLEEVRSFYQADAEAQVALPVFWLQAFKQKHLLSPFRGVLTASGADKSLLAHAHTESRSISGDKKGERKMTDVEKQADAIVHAVVAVELLHWHGKLGGTLEPFGRIRCQCVYVPVLPRLKRLTNRKDSADDFKIDMKTGRKLSRPSRVHDAALEKQFTLGFAFTGVALDALSRGDNGVWLPLARYQARRELNLADVEPGEDPQAKDLVAFSQGFVKSDAGQEMVQVTSRAVGHGDARQNIWILPVFVDHDRSSHAERQALLVLLQAAPIDPVSEGVKKGVTGQMRVFASHTPCISCLSSMCQFTRCFEGWLSLVTYDTWKETRRWIGLDPPDEIPSEEDEEEKASFAETATGWISSQVSKSQTCTAFAGQA
ncbi:osm1 [Symbiodinium sp. CCMP2456]|nr:osm1 [Symbiodinium sp. CCMP2456]